MNAIIILGRGVGRNKKGKWEPTPYFEVLNEGRHQINLQAEADPNGPTTAIGGGMTNTLAAFFYYKKRISTNPQAVIVFAAGRPDYLKNEAARVSEGSVMKKEFLKLIKEGNLPTPRCLVLSKNKNTQEDMEGSLKVLVKIRAKNASVITVGVHIPRAKEFLKLAQKKIRKKHGIKINFISSEEILSKNNPSYKLFLN